MAKLGVALTEGRTGSAAAAPAAELGGDTPMANGSADGEEGGAAASKHSEPKQETAVRPAAFKSLVGRGHAEFASNRQQARTQFSF
jgi:ubiquitin carboxyl-terminal hydrolase 5/13